MKLLPENIKTLKRISEKLNKLMSDKYTPVEIRSTDLYDYIIKDKNLKALFYNQRSFNQFLREQHDKGILKQIIPNYRVDTTKKTYYQWFFFKNKSANTNKKKSAINGNYIHYKKNLTIKTSDNNFVRSEQEKTIYEYLIQNQNLLVVYDFLLEKNGKKKIVDFYIKNQLTQKEFFWEHFGMTNNEGYLDKIPNILNWYKSNDIKTISDDGNLFITFFKDINSFQKEIENNIRIINNEKKNIIVEPNSDIKNQTPSVSMYIAVKHDETTNKGTYSVLLKHINKNIKYQKSFVKNFYLTQIERIYLSAILDGILKLKRKTNLKIYLLEQSIIDSVMNNTINNINLDIICKIKEQFELHNISFRIITKSEYSNSFNECEENLYFD